MILKQAIFIDSQTSVFIKQSGIKLEFTNAQSWIISSLIERRIKDKIEALGTPLKNWNIQINYGIKTGLNEAFIIDGQKRQELIQIDPRSDEIIRPILRGRDIKRYICDFSDLHLIATLPSKKINIDDYVAVKQHLMSFGYHRLNQSGEPGSRKKTTNKWFETQDSISYWEDFSKQKIIYPNMTKFLPFYYDTEGFFTNQKCFIITGENIAYLTAFLNSSLFKFCFRDNFPELQGGTRELSKIFFDQIPVLKVSASTEAEFQKIIRTIQRLKNQGEDTINLEKEADQLIFNLYELTIEERNMIGFIEIQ